MYATNIQKSCLNNSDINDRLPQYLTILLSWHVILDYFGLLFILLFIFYCVFELGVPIMLAPSAVCYLPCSHPFLGLEPWSHTCWCSCPYLLASDWSQYSTSPVARYTAVVISDLYSRIPALKTITRAFKCSRSRNLISIIAALLRHRAGRTHSWGGYMRSSQTSSRHIVHFYISNLPNQRKRRQHSTHLWTSRP